ncbi:MAG: shikimate dehydrogenase, partial [Mycobacteriales bacterium]
MRAAVAGRPIGHSLSPRLHRAAYAALGLDWSYEALDCGAAELGALLGQVRAAAAEWAGLSLTMPLKEAVLRHLDVVATDLGAVNTVLVGPDGRLTGENTDVDGIRAGLVELLGSGRPLERAAVLGAGGTARAALAALASLGAGVGEVGLYARDADRGET